MKRLLLALVLIGVSFCNAYSQSPVTTQPYGATSNNSSSTITATTTFQSLWSASTTTTGRVGCMVQNKGSNNMFVFFGALASATTPSSVTLAAGASLNCNAGAIVLRDQVSITGTSGDAFFAAQQ